jgi:adenylate kinase family enzyme
MKRVLVTGSTGAGKTALARTIAERLAIPFHEMDALAFAGPDWKENENLAEDAQARSRSAERFQARGNFPVAVDGH